MYDGLVTKVKSIDARGFVLITKYDTDKSYLENKISDVDKKFLMQVDFLKKTDHSAKITEIESKITSINDLATNTALTAVKNKISNVGNFVRKSDYDEEILDIKSKYFTATDYNKFTNEKLDLKIKQKQLADKFGIAGFINNSDLNKKVATLATKAELKAEQEKIIKLQAFDSTYFRGKSYL